MYYNREGMNMYERKKERKRERSIYRDFDWLAMSDCYACVCYIWCNEREARRKEGKKREEYRVGTSVLDFVCVVSSQPAAKKDLVFENKVAV